MAISATQAIPDALDFPDGEKPYVENIAGRLEPKLSPKLIHSRLQLRLGRILEDWAGDRGVVGTEIRTYLLDASGRSSSLVPDVAYFSFERLPSSLPEDARERPRLAPDIVVEIWSPGDRERTLEQKIGLYLAPGSTVVIVIYPAGKHIAFHRHDGATTYDAEGVISVAPYPDLAIDCDKLFRGL